MAGIFTQRLFRETFAFPTTADVTVPAGHHWVIRNVTVTCAGQWWDRFNGFDITSLANGELLHDESARLHKGRSWLYEGRWVVDAGETLQIASLDDTVVVRADGFDFTS